MTIDLTHIEAASPLKESDPERAEALRVRFQALLYGDRVRTDPTDQWSALTPPLTEAQVAELRAVALDLDDVISGGVFRERVEQGEGYTCDGCGARFTCPLVFDCYNTDGDCLMEK